MKYRRAALFDLDGVVIDTRAATMAALAGLATAHGCQPAPGHVARAAALPPPKAFLALGIANAQHVYDTEYDAALASAVNHVQPFAGVLEGMAQLAAEGVGIAIVTAQARRRLDYLLPPTVALLAETVIAHEDARPKPAPDPVLAACRALGVPTHRAVFVGDTVTDIAAGKTAGVTTAGAAWGYAGADVLRRAGADVILNDPQDIAPELARRLPMPS